MDAGPYHTTMTDAPLLHLTLSPDGVADTLGRYGQRVVIHPGPPSEIVPILGKIIRTDRIITPHPGGLPEDASPGTHRVHSAAPGIALYAGFEELGGQLLGEIWQGHTLSTNNESAVSFLSGPHPVTPSVLSALNALWDAAIPAEEAAATPARGSAPATTPATARYRLTAPMQSDFTTGFRFAPYCKPGSLIPPCPVTDDEAFLKSVTRYRKDIDRLRAPHGPHWTLTLTNDAARDLQAQIDAVASEPPLTLTELRRRFKFAVERVIGQNSNDLTAPENLVHQHAMAFFDERTRLLEESHFRTILERLEPQTRPMKKP